jgi:phosphatidate phosphatase LPIN
MKIGDAGEAFFVFETEDDVPDELITSPLLQPTRPEDVSGSTEEVRTGAFGAKEDEDEKITSGSDEVLHTTEAAEEPDFLDLNDSSAPIASTATVRPPDLKEQSDVSQPQALPSPPPSPKLSPSSLLTRAEEKIITPARKAEEAAAEVVQNFYGQNYAPNVISKPGKSKFLSTK